MDDQNAPGAPGEDESASMRGGGFGDGPQQVRAGLVVGQGTTVLAAIPFRTKEGGGEFGKVDLGQVRSGRQAIPERLPLEVDERWDAGAASHGHQLGLETGRETGRHGSGYHECRSSGQPSLDRGTDRLNTGSIHRRARFDQFGDLATSQGGLDYRCAGTQPTGTAVKPQAQSFGCGHGRQLGGVVAPLPQALGVDTQAMEYATDVNPLARNIEMDLLDSVDFPDVKTVEQD
jgi:hypothetical protein